MAENVLVLDVTWSPVDVVSVQRAISLCIVGKATAVLEHEDRIYRSQHLTIKVPRVISLKVYVPLSRTFTAKVTKRVMFARDEYRCQYCGKYREELPKGMKLTKDHVKPVCRFDGESRAERYAKADTWENVVTACESCNQKKENKTPMEAKMYPLKVPRRPTGIAITFYERVDTDLKDYIQPFL